MDFKWNLPALWGTVNSVLPQDVRNSTAITLDPWMRER